LPAMTTVWAVPGDDDAEAVREQLAAGRRRDAGGVLVDRAVEVRRIVPEVPGSFPPPLRYLPAGVTSCRAEIAPVGKSEPFHGAVLGNASPIPRTPKATLCLSAIAIGRLGEFRPSSVVFQGGLRPNARPRGSKPAVRGTIPGIAWKKPRGRVVRAPESRCWNPRTSCRSAAGQGGFRRRRHSLCFFDS
jgi:hypothetical protein